ncbi:hypothetical protein A6X21_03100 [Planctopirus hydrillae]|uniref:Uncharacterized protein n=1 Tax=Planctopirus hydrillae TaxID=1841610 RepID=A0A1C3EN79_9PLAN|nr:hypothetical protein A6X21_03100 [Planctopirus hydrillae]
MARSALSLHYMADRHLFQRMVLVGNKNRRTCISIELYVHLHANGTKKDSKQIRVPRVEFPRDSKKNSHLTRDFQIHRAERLFCEKMM